MERLNRGGDGDGMARLVYFHYLSQVSLASCTLRTAPNKLCAAATESAYDLCRVVNRPHYSLST